MIKVVGQKRTLKEWFWNVSNDIKIWWSENKEWAIIVIPAALGVTTWLIKRLITEVGSNVRLSRERALKELYIYDRSLGCYHKISRPLRSSDILEINQRRKVGESLAEILRSMRLI